MSIRLADTAVPMNDTGYPVARAKHIWFDDDATLQDKLDNKELSGGDSAIVLTEEEFNLIPLEERLENEYYCYDTKKHYKNNILYSGTPTVELETLADYEALEAAGGVDPEATYIIKGDSNGTFLDATDISYNDETVYGAIEGIRTEVLLAKDEATNPIKTTLDIALAENDCDNIPSLMEDMTIVVSTVSSDTVAHTPKYTFATETGFFEITTTRQNSTYAWQTAKRSGGKPNVFQRCMLDGVWEQWRSVGVVRDDLMNDINTWSSSKIASEIGAKSTKTQYRGSQSIDISTSSKLTFIYSSMYASQAGCYMLLSNYNTEPLLIELGKFPQSSFNVTATNKSFGVDTITVTTASDEYSWYVLQF